MRTGLEVMVVWVRRRRRRGRPWGKEEAKQQDAVDGMAMAGKAVERGRGEETRGGDGGGVHRQRHGGRIGLRGSR